MVEVYSHLSHLKLLIVAVTGAVIVSDIGDVAAVFVTEAVEAEEEGVEDTEAVVLAAWWRTARRWLFSFSEGPRWRGRRGGGAGGWEEKEEGGKEWRASGGPSVQFSCTLVTPALVVRFREASPPWAQTETNSVREADKNWELDLAAIVTTIITENCLRNDWSQTE